MSSLIKCKKNGQLIKILTNLNRLNNNSTKLILNHLIKKTNYYSSNQFNCLTTINRHYSTAIDRQNDDEFINNPNFFIKRHIGPRPEEKKEMLNKLGYDSMEDFISATIPKRIKLNNSLNLDKPLTETDLLKKLKKICSVNAHEWRSYIGMGYYNCITPAVIQRNIFENPGWYTPYTLGEKNISPFDIS